MKNNDSAALYAKTFTIPEENRVPGFDPIRFLKMTSTGPKLDLGTKKVWFRLKYPQGKVLLTAAKIDQQLAMIEARVFLNKTDTAPAFISTVQRMLSEVPGGMYIQAAQDAAIEQVLDEAGFTVQINGVAIPSQSVSAVMAHTHHNEKTDTVQQPFASVQKDVTVNKPEVHVTEHMQVPAQSTVVEQQVAKEPIKASVASAEVVTDITAQPSVETTAPQTETAEPVSEILVEQMSIEAQSIETPENTADTVQPIAKVTTTPILESIAIPEAETAPVGSADESVRYTKDMPVEEIRKLMTVEEALNYEISSGSCKGWKMSQAIARRPASVKFYCTPGYKGDDNILRASAAIVLAEIDRLMAS